MTNKAYFLGALLITMVILLAFCSGCSFKESGTLDCKTVTEVKRVCESKGGGSEIRITPGAMKGIDE